MEIENLIAEIDGYRAALEGFIDSMTMVKRDKSALFEQRIGFVERSAWRVWRGAERFGFRELLLWRQKRVFIGKLWARYGQPAS